MTMSGKHYLSWLLGLSLCAGGTAKAEGSGSEMGSLPNAAAGLVKTKKSPAPEQPEGTRKASSNTTEFQIPVPDKLQAAPESNSAASKTPEAPGVGSAPEKKSSAAHSSPGTTMGNAGGSGQGSVGRSRPDMEQAKDTNSQRSPAALEAEIREYQRRYLAAIHAIQESRQRQTTAARQDLPKSATLKQIEENIKRAEENMKQVHPAVYQAFKGNEPEIALDRADLLFLMGRYQKALQQYHVVRDDRRFDDTLDDSDRAWTLFQIGQCEMLLHRPGKASDGWKKTGKYFSERGYQSVGEIENAIRSFSGGADAAQNWSTGFWRRQAGNELQNAESRLAFFKLREQVKERMKVLRERARSYVPEPHLRLQGPQSEQGEQ